MSSQSTINPYDILHMRRKLKQYKKHSATDMMKLLRRVREMNLDNKMLIATEIPRTLVWISNRTSSSQDENIKKMSKMCRYLAKEWRKQLGLQKKDQSSKHDIPAAEENEEKNKDKNGEAAESEKNGIQQQAHKTNGVAEANKIEEQQPAKPSQM